MNDSTVPAIPHLEEFEARRAHAQVKIKWSLPAELRESFLDIGCGIGNGLVAALQEGFRSAVGIDRDLKEFPWFEPSSFSALCRHYAVDPARATLIQGDIFEVELPRNSFDAVFMLDSIEHVPDPRAFVQIAASKVSRGGCLLIDTCPLYYSRSGHHLFGHLPPERFPWAHLRKDFRSLVRSHGVDDWSWQRFEELNRVTHDQVRSYVEDSGLVITHDERRKPTAKDTTLLDEHRPVLNLDGIDERLLFEDWLLIVARQPD